MIRNRGEHEIIIVLNGLFPESIEPIRAEFDELLSQENIRVWYSQGPVHGFDSGNDWRRHTAEFIREAFLASLQPDIVHVTSLMDGFADNAVHSIGLSPYPIPTAVTFYDLIPLIQSEVYLAPNPAFEILYREKLDYLRRAELYLAISESARLEAIKYLYAKPDQVTNIAAATEEYFQPAPTSRKHEDALRAKMGLNRPFLMYSGATDERKNHLRLIKAYSLLPVDLQSKYQLAIVGHLPKDHIAKFEEYINLCGLSTKDVVITGRVSDEELVTLYRICHVFVFPSWHEGFGLPALEAMSCGAPVIASNTTSLPEVIGLASALFDPFDERSIRDKIVEVLTNDRLREELARHGLVQAKKFSWNESAKRTLTAFEHWYAENCHNSVSVEAKKSAWNYPKWLVEKITKISVTPVLENDWLETAQAIAQNHSVLAEKQLLVDISELAHRDHKTGIQRVVRSVLAELLSNPPHGFRVEPVYAVEHESGYRYARAFSRKFMQSSDDAATDDKVELACGDIFLGLDLQHHVVSQQAAFYAHLRRIGVQVNFVIYDLLPVLMPQAFPEGLPEIHAEWLSTLAQIDGVLCISRAVADEMKEWLDVFGPRLLRPLKLGWFHLGADLVGSVPTGGLPDGSGDVLQRLSSRPTFLMVGTIEPRKGQMQTLLAFERLWNDGVDVNLVMVGKRGWKVDCLVEILRSHSERNRRLFWLDGVSDEYLDKVYVASNCLIAASDGEGFGLPLIEAAQHKIPIIARDIPVFREVAGVHAHYFSESSPYALAGNISEWLALDMQGRAPQSDAMPWLTWKQSTKNLLDVLLDDQWYQQWMPDDVRRFWGGDSRLGTQVGKRSGRDISSSGKAGYLFFGPYVSLNAGQYRVVIRGIVGKNGATGARMDVAVDQGNLILGESIFGKPDKEGCLVSMPISLDSACTDLEIRVWVDDDTDLKVSMIEISPWQADDVFNYWGGDKRLGTQVGERIGLGMATTGQTGYLLFGPYIPLAMGQYRVALYGTLGKNGLVGAKIDVAVDKGRVILGESAFSWLGADGCLVSLVVSLETPCTDLEVRVWVGDDTDLHISMIEIAPWQGDCQIGDLVPAHITLKDRADHDVSGTPTEHQEPAQVVVSESEVRESASDGVLTKEKAEVSYQELTSDVDPPYSVISINTNTNKLALIQDGSVPQTFTQSVVIEILPEYPLVSNDSSTALSAATAIAAKKQLLSSKTERNRSKANRKKNR
jgi:glycosyltransferase involved in cell wall biosynthesis